MTSVQSALFDSTERRSELSDLVDAFRELRGSGRGHLEVNLPDSLYPYLTLSFLDDHAVVHLFTSEDSVSLLVGDGSVSPEGQVDVPVMDDLGTFTGDFVMRVDRAWDVIENFVRAGTVEGLGEWYEL
ncbi:hypothetical protein [Streptomyces pseudovenezuelae]|uniref:Uncharacterized protein n=1 Tax=Streptomyces pseudovenezuelae TaxID=67350 RepID=A0ABT6LZD9_9ACTN|nr:hypothetical protein [Streptomyces pseudovenezuelae]MDH6221672.1 hypothetical protein [Streptomyces pseudovenezuelae]